jgi:hypothetical protein
VGHTVHMAPTPCCHSATCPHAATSPHDANLARLHYHSPVPPLPPCHTTALPLHNSCCHRESSGDCGTIWVSVALPPARSAACLCTATCAGMVRGAGTQVGCTSSSGAWGARRPRAEAWGTHHPQAEALCVRRPAEHVASVVGGTHRGGVSCSPQAQASA